MQIKVGKTPGEIREFSFDNGTTVAQALEVAGLNPAGYEIRVDASVQPLSYVLNDDNSIVLLVKQIKGNF